MDKETLSNYGWIVICILVLSVMIALATPFGRYIATAVENTTEALFKTQQSALSAADIEVMGQEFEDMFNGGGTDVVIPEETPTECQHTNTTTINASSTYTGDTYCNDCNTTIATGTKTVDPALNPDDGTGVYDGMIYTSGNYEYSYNQYYSYNVLTKEGSWKTDTAQNGWGVRVLDTTKTTYGAILESINGKPVTTLKNTFNNCTSLNKAPEIPSSVTDMSSTFWRCNSLTTAPEIPNSVTNMQGTFQNCNKLTTAPVIPSSVTNMQNTFSGCTALTTAPDMSKATSVTNMSSTFWGCTSLTTAPAIPSSVTSMSGTFLGCTSLTTAPAIPSNVTDMSSTFNNCTSLTTAPAIPSSVTNMRQTFNGCASLTDEISIPCSLVSQNYTYTGCTATITYYHTDSCDGSCGK